MRICRGRSCLVGLALTSVIAVRAAGQASSAPPTYSSGALQSLLAAAATVNAQIPERLRGYRAMVESEMSLALLDSGGRERTAQVEQIESAVRYRAPDSYDQRVVGYRSQAIGPVFSLMSIFGGWTTPTLYGNRLQLGVTSATDGNNWPPSSTSGMAIHPLSASRDTYYTFEGGDTAVILYSRGGRIPVVRVRVTPKANAPGDAILFFGDMHLDADRKQIVRLRGRMVEIKGGKQTIKAGSRIPGVSGASFVELVNVEVNGEYWLPAYQRTELQARISVFGELRTIVRIVSRFHDYEINDSSWIARLDSTGIRRGRLTFAPTDSLTRFHAWQEPLGKLSNDAQYADFDDLAPEAWRTVGESTTRFSPRSFGEMFRFNRVEGVFTGISAARDFRDDVPGLSLRGSLGWAWAEGTARGMLGIEQTRGRTTTGIRVERALANTNDFQLPLSWGATLSALLGSTDDFDYLDRRSATAYVSRTLGAKRRSLIRLEAGPASDNPVRQHISRGLYVATGEGFIFNRDIRAGSYMRSAADFEVNPQVSGMFVDRGVGARLHYERADGKLHWQRLELRAAARREVGPFQLYARGDAGTLFGAPAPQAMFEIGRGEGLSAFGYKKFGGDRAAIVRAVAGYTFPFLRAPIHLPSQLIVPGLAPGVAAGIHSAWADVSGAAAERALLDLGTKVDPATGGRIAVSRPTDGVRASTEVLLTFFSGAVGIGAARQVDRHAPWKFTGRIGQGF
jgi:hypothetical protein